MTGPARLADIRVGTVLPPATFHLTRSQLVRYAGASGDFNVIHWSERAARAVGLPSVIAHGMLTMAQAARVVTDWVDDPGALVSYGVRFTRPVPVPDDDSGAQIQVTGTVAELLADGLVRVDLVARCGEEKVLGQARATVRLA